MSEDKFLKSDLLKAASIEEKLELATRALCLTARAQVSTAKLFETMLDRFEELLRRLESKSWERAIKAELERRENAPS